MFGKHRSDVLVVGAGPTGLFTALKLAERGVKVRIVDRHWRTGVHSYALALHSRSLELLDQVGVASRLLEHGRRVETVSFWEGGEQRATVELGRLERKYPYVLVLPQSLLEAELENRLLREKIKVQWNQRLESIGEEGDQLIAEVSHLDRVAAGYPIARSEWNVVKTSKVLARYFVGADGYHSKLRDLLGIEYEQIAAQTTFAVYEIEADEDAGGELCVLFEDDKATVRWPMTGRRARWSFQVEHPEQYEPTVVRLNELIGSRTHGGFRPVRGEVIWSSLVQFDRRLAHGVGSGKIWLAGDALHLTSPVGVQSMNAGLIDGYELAWRLAELLTGDRASDVLASYEPERMAELRPLFGSPVGYSCPAGAEEWVSRRWTAIVSSIPATGEQLETLLSQIAGPVRAS
jgi:2-polyprenyl-6-methoxyphenol hydroxylase-like FAD-dependent oxidoreductase